MNFPYVVETSVKMSKEETVIQSSTEKPQNPPVCQILQMTTNYILKRVHGNYSLTGKHVLDESDYKYIQIPNTLLNDMHINSCQYQLH